MYLFFTHKIDANIHISLHLVHSYTQRECNTVVCRLFLCCSSNNSSKRFLLILILFEDDQGAVLYYCSLFISNSKSARNLVYTS